MRTNDILLDGFNDIRTLQRYLYMSDEHYICLLYTSDAADE